MATSTLGSGTLVLAGTTSGTTTVTATAVAGTTTLTLPAATDTLVGKATTDTLTNKTLTGAAMNGTVGATTPSTGAFTTLSATGNVTLGDASTDTLNVGNGDLIKDASGNLGLGVTPSAWAVYKTFDKGSCSFNTAGVQGELTSNGFFNASSAWIYKATGFANRYVQNLSANGVHAWFNAASGTAGNAITFTQAMTLSAVGYLGIAETSPPNPLSIKSDGTATGNGWNEISSFRNAAQSKGLNIGYNPSANNATLVSQSGGSASGMEFWGYTGSAWAERMRIDSSGNLLVGKTNSTGINAGAVLSPAGGFTLTRTGTSASDQVVFYRGTAGSEVYVGTITTTGTATSYVTSSDYRLKNTIAPMTGALAKVALLKPCTYKWNVDGSDGEGFIAHELSEVVPQCVTGEKDAVDADGNPKYQGIDTSFLVATLTAAIQELKAEFDAYKESHP
jgi:hypothetical protein